MLGDLTEVDILFERLRGNQFMEKLVQSIRESYNELINKVSWPSWPNLQQSTILVLVASLIIALLVFIMDSLSKQIVDILYNI